MNTASSVWIKFTLLNIIYEISYISLYRNNAGKYRITCDYPISPSSSLEFLFTGKITAKILSLREFLQLSCQQITILDLK